MRIAVFLVGLSLAGLSLAASRAPDPAPRTTHPLLRTIAADVRPEEMHATIAKLVGFGTRHTLSDTVSDTRGIGAARRWVPGRFTEISRGCGGCLQIETPEETVTGNRVPTPTKIVNVLAIQRGTSDPNRVI